MSNFKCEDCEDTGVIELPATIVNGEIVDGVNKKCICQVEIEELETEELDID